MAHPFHIIPDTTATAAQNMAYDFLLLQRYQPADAIRFRHYEWSRPAYTFGLSQNYSYVTSEISDLTAEICRRPTGGGVVDHNDDWTYTLVIPASHPLSKGQPIESYRAIHQCMVNALESQDLLTELNYNTPEEAAPSVCFNKAELYDVVLKNLPSKVAGAAQKRTKNGYMLQGSIWKPLASKITWARFYNDFTIELAKLLEAEIEYVSTPSWTPEEEEALTAQFDSDAWNQRR
ncbi:biotin/lipoate A/B protein ligase family [Verrucomicrobiia bacterium DG1235]|nr:biotin/lipoate A/B protein ligase family [Verrucomicrobiae bacterium DG1235]